MLSSHLQQGRCILLSASGAPKVNRQKLNKLCYRSFGPIGPSHGRSTHGRIERLSVNASALSDLVSVTFFTTAAAGLIYSSIPLLNGASKTRNQGKIDTSAIDDEAQAAKYYAYAAIYALPVLRNGFNIDSFLVAAVLLCAAHVQIERVANTEPVGVDVPAISDISKSARQLTDSTKEWSASVQETNERRRREKQQLEEQNTEQYRRKLSADELASWDARLEDVRRKAKDTQDG